MAKTRAIVGTLACDCTLVLGKAGIRYCRLHRAAPEMQKALEMIRDVHIHTFEMEHEAEQALAAARGQEVEACERVP